MNRRHFISSLAACFYSTVLFKSPLLHAGTNVTSIPNKEINSVVSKFFSNIESAKVIGQHYLNDYPSSANKKQLLHESGINDLNGDLTSKSVIRQSLLKKQQTDFQKGNTIKIEHWILSRSEASLCALLLFI